MVVAGLVLVLDQLAKWLARGSISLGSERVELLPFLDLRYVRNTGVAFGLLEGQGQLVALGTLIVAGLLVLTLTTVRPSDRPMTIAIALIAGGAVGNLVDRVRDGFVTDFIHVPHWPTFNVADIAIVLGVAIVLLQQVVLSRDAEPAASAGAGATAQPADGTDAHRD